MWKPGNARFLFSELEPKCRRHAYKEVSGDNGFGMIAYEGYPPLRRDLGPRRPVWHVTANRARRNLNSDLQQKLICDPFLTPGRIVRSHVDDQLSEIDRNSWPTIRPGLPLPKEPESFPMPTDQRVWLNDR